MTGKNSRKKQNEDSKRKRHGNPPKKIIKD